MMKLFWWWTVNNGPHCPGEEDVYLHYLFWSRSFFPVLLFISPFFVLVVSIFCSVSVMSSMHPFPVLVVSLPLLSTAVICPLPIPVVPLFFSFSFSLLFVTFLLLLLPLPLQNCFFL